MSRADGHSWRRPDGGLQEGEQGRPSAGRLEDREVMKCGWEREADSLTDFTTPADPIRNRHAVIAPLIHCLFSVPACLRVSPGSSRIARLADRPHYQSVSPTRLHFIYPPVVSPPTSSAIHSSLLPLNSIAMVAMTTSSRVASPTRPVG